MLSSCYASFLASIRIREKGLVSMETHSTGFSEHREDLKRFALMNNEDNEKWRGFEKVLWNKLDLRTFLKNYNTTSLYVLFMKICHSNFKEQ